MRKCEEVDDDGDETKKNASSDYGPLGFSMICRKKAKGHKMDTTWSWIQQTWIAYGQEKAYGEGNYNKNGKENKEQGELPIQKPSTGGWFKFYNMSEPANN